MRFEPNRGQVDARWGFVARTADGTILLGDSEVRLGTTELTMPGADAGATWEAIEPLPGRAHYLLGDDPARWVLDVPTYAALIRRSAYPGIDVVLRGASRRAELEFVVAPGADASAIAVLRDGKAIGFDVPRGARAEVVRVGIAVEVSDPAAAPEPPRLAADAEGQLFLAGRVAGGAATTFVTMLDATGSDVLRTTYLDGLDASSPVALAVSPLGEIAVAGTDGGDAALVVVDRSGRKILRRAVVGGAGTDEALAVAVDAAGGAWLAGRTTSTDLPAARNAIHGAIDGFVARVDASGTLAFTSYLGGESTDEARGLAIDREGDGYVVGTMGADTFAARVDAKGMLVYSSVIGGSADAIAVTSSGEAVVAGTGGSGAFLAQLDPAGSVIFSTPIGSGPDDRAKALALDRRDVAWITGSRGTGVDADTFVVQLSLEKRSIVGDTVLAGERDDVASGVVVDGNGDGVVAGLTTSDELPDAARPESTRGGDVFVARIEGAEPAPRGTCPGTRNFDANVSNAWEVAENWSGNVLPTASDDVCIQGFNVVLNGTGNAGTLRVEGGSLTLNAGTLTVAGASEITGSLTIAGGTMTGAGNVTTSGSFSFTSGTISGSGVTTSNGPVSVSGALAKGVFAHRWDVNGNATWTGTGSLGVASGAVVNNAAVWDCQSDATLIWTVGTATAFNNSGTFKKSAGAGTTTVQAPFYNTGTVLIQTGLMNFNSGGSSTGNFDIAASTTMELLAGGYDFNAGTTLTGSGTLLLDVATLNVNAAVTIPASITFNMAGGFLGSTGTLTVNGPLNWTGGTMQHGGVTTCNGALNISGAIGKGMQLGRTLNVNATATLTGTGSLTTSTSSIINNVGTWDCQSDASIVWGVGTFPMFNNSGTFKKSAGAGTTTFQMPITNTGAVLVQAGSLNFNSGTDTSTGSFDVAAGRTLQFGGNTFNLDAGTTFTGPGRILLSATTLGVNAAIGIPATMTFDMTGGILTGTGTLTTAGPLNWTGGTMQSTGVTTCNGTLTLSGAGAKGIQLSRTLNINANAVVVGTASLGISSAAVINNPGTWDFQGDGSIVWGVGTAPSFNNTGTLKKSAGTGTSFVQLPFVNDGVVLVQTGTINSNQGGSSTGSFGLSAGTTLQFGGGTFSLNAGTTFTGIGNLLLSAATLNVNDAVATPATIVVDMTGGTMQAAGTFTAGGIFNYSGGSFGSVGITNFNGALNVFGTAAKGISSRTLNTNGTTTWSGAGANLGLSFAAIINNNGTWEVLNDGSMAWGVGGAPVFRNLGTFRKSVGVGTTTLQLPYQNQGTVDIQSGTINANNYTQTAGTTKLTGGAFTSTATIGIQGGTLAGTGTVTGPVVVSGTGALSPGLSAGTLALTGTYTQQAPNGAFNVEIGGLAPGTQHDRANVTSTTTLAGVLNVSLINGFVPLPGDSFTVLTYPSKTGTFATVNFPSVGCIGWRLSYGATALVLTAAAVPEEIAAFTMTSKTAFSWSSAPTYANTTYNVLRGDLDKLPVGPGADETCAVPSTTGTTGSDAATPVSGKGFWYLVRETVTGCGTGTYGFRSGGTERISTACP